MGEPAWVLRLVLAADQFLVHRPQPGHPDGRSVIAGYPWFGDWGRDTMIALPGLALAEQLYAGLKAQGHGRDGTHALELALASLSGIDWLQRK